MATATLRLEVVDVPLVAVVEGQRVVSFDCDELTWKQLRVRSKAGDVTLPVCGRRAYLRTSPAGLQHFAHQPGVKCDADHPGESPRHLAAKRELVLLARAAGWVAEPEVPGPDYVADVEATDPAGRRVIFEVQLSAQTHPEYVERTRQRVASGAQVLWLAKVGKPRSAYAAKDPLTIPNESVPVVELLEPDDGSWQVKVGQRAVPLATFVSVFLAGHAAPRAQVSGPAWARVEIMENVCWRCRRPSLVWSVEETVVRGRCGTPGRKAMQSAMWADDRPENLGVIKKGVAAYARAKSMPQLAVLARRHSQTVRGEYLAFTCPSCTALFGDFFLRSAWMEASYEDGVQDVEVPMGVDMCVSAPHWCRDVGKGMCDNRRANAAEPDDDVLGDAELV